MCKLQMFYNSNTIILCLLSDNFFGRISMTTDQVFCFSLYPDIDECAMNISKCKGSCQNNEGHYRCSCRVGYKLASDGYTCSGNEFKILSKFFFLFIDNL